MTVIIKGEQFAIESHGNGAYYLLRDRTNQRSVFFQGDDALEFESRLTSAEAQWPEASNDHICRFLWSDCEYGLVAEPDRAP